MLLDIMRYRLILLVLLVACSDSAAIEPPPPPPPPPPVSSPMRVTITATAWARSPTSCAVEVQYAPSDTARSYLYRLDGQLHGSQWEQIVEAVAKDTLVVRTVIDSLNGADIWAKADSLIYPIGSQHNWTWERAWEILRPATNPASCVAS